MNEIEAAGAKAIAPPQPESAGTAKERSWRLVMLKQRPWLFALLIAPSAVLANGVIQGGALSYLLRNQGIKTGIQSHIIWLLSLPTMIYFLWSPITDFLMPRRIWLLTGSLAAGLLMAAAFQASSLDSRGALILMFLSACCGQLVVSSCGGMLGALGVERAKRMAGSFYQGGGLAFGAAAVFVLVLADVRVSRGLLGWLAAALIAVPGLSALAAPRQEVIADHEFGKTMRRIWGEFKSTFLRWRAVPYTLCMVFPLASDSAIGLLPGVARDYGVNGEHVAWINGLGGAFLMAAGSLSATLIPVRFRASVAYLTVALVNAATLGVLWLGPLRPWAYYLGLTLYLFTIGTSYAMFTAVLLEFMGDSGKSGSGRYSIINSLGNVPVVYMIALDGWGGNKWGPRGIAGTEAVAGAAAALVLLAYFLTRKPNRTSAAEIAAAAS